jgi:hypothetical protein
VEALEMAVILLGERYDVQGFARGWQRRSSGPEARPGQQTQSVAITEALPLVDATSPTMGGTLDNADINDMPLNGRNYQSFLNLRPCLVIQPGGSPWTQSSNNTRPDETVCMGRRDS